MCRGQRGLEFIVEQMEERVPFILSIRKVHQRTRMSAKAPSSHALSSVDIVLEKLDSPGLPQLPKRNLYPTQLQTTPRKHLNIPKGETSKGESKEGRGTPMQVGHKPLSCQEKRLLLFKTAENLWYMQFNFKTDFSNQTWMLT